MPSPPISPPSWGPPSRKTTRELALFAVLGLMFLAVALFEPYSTEKPLTRAPAAQDLRDNLPLSKRLGYAILLRAKYASVKFDDRPDNPGFELTPQDPPELRCLEEGPDLELPGRGRLYVPYLVRAIVAAEKYNRPPLTRQAEAWMAARLLGLRGRLPEFSLGLAQIRPATARRLLADELKDFRLSDADLLALLMDDCHNVRLAGKYVAALCEEHVTAESVDDLIARVAQTYIGAETTTISGLRYVDAVMGAYHLLAGDDDEDSGSPRVRKDGEKEKNIVCLTFPLGKDADEEGGIERLKTLFPDQNQAAAGPTPAPPAKKEMAAVKIYLWTAESGPPAYRAQLAARRQGWLLEQLTKMGVARERISVTELSSAKLLRVLCGYEVPWSRAAIEVKWEEPGPPPTP